MNGCIRMPAALLACLLLAGCRGGWPGAGERQLRAGMERLQRAVQHESTAKAGDPAVKADFAAAADLLRAAADKRPYDPTPYANLGIACQRLGRTEEALQALKEAARLTTNDPRPLEWLVQIYSGGRQWREARQALDQANRRCSYSPRVLNAMAVVEYRAGETNLATVFLGQALKLNPDYAPALYNHAVLQRDAFKNREKTKVSFERFLAAAKSGALPADATPFEKETLSQHVAAAENWLKPPTGQPSPGTPPTHRVGRETTPTTPRGSSRGKNKAVR